MPPRAVLPLLLACLWSWTWAAPAHAVQVEYIGTKCQAKWVSAYQVNVTICDARYWRSDGKSTHKITAYADKGGSYQLTAATQYVYRSTSYTGTSSSVSITDRCSTSVTSTVYIYGYWLFTAAFPRTC